MSYNKQIFKILLVIAILAALQFIITHIVSLLIYFFPKIAPYAEGIDVAVRVIIIAIGGYYIIKFLQVILSISLYSKLEKGLAGTLKFAFDVALYTILILAILSVLHVNLTGVLVGGAVGGIVVGLAVQTVAQNLLSGVLVTSSKTVKPGDSISLISWIWGNPIIGEVTKVSLLFTEIKSITGNIFKIPNSAFLGNTVFQKLDTESSIVYPLQILLNADVSAERVLTNVREILRDKINDKKVEIYFTSKNGSTNVFTAILHMNKIEELRDLINVVNSAFDKAYWSAKT